MPLFGILLPGSLLAQLKEAIFIDHHRKTFSISVPLCHWRVLSGKNLIDQWKVLESAGTRIRGWRHKQHQHSAVVFEAS